MYISMGQISVKNKHVKDKHYISAHTAISTNKRRYEVQTKTNNLNIYGHALQTYRYCFTLIQLRGHKPKDIMEEHQNLKLVLHVLVIFSNVNMLPSGTYYQQYIATFIYQQYIDIKNNT